MRIVPAMDQGIVNRLGAFEEFASTEVGRRHRELAGDGADGVQKHSDDQSIGPPERLDLSHR